MKHALHSTLFALGLSLLCPDAAAQGNALRFDGDDDLVTVLDNLSDFDLGSALTLEAWVQVDQANAGGAFVGGRTSPGGGSWALTGGFGSPTSAFMTVSTPSTDAAFASGTIAPGPQWTHYAGTFDGTLISLYVDGVLAAEKIHPSPGTSTSVAQLILGRFPAGTSNFFEGTLDEIRVWNTVRTAAEIQGNFNVQVASASPGLVAYYMFDETSGDVVLDSSARGNHGILGNTQGAGPDDPTRVVSGAPIDSGGLGTNYCSPGVSNSTGVPGVMSAAGSALASSNDVTLKGSSLPNFSFGFFITSTSQGFTSSPVGSEGNLCLSGAIGRFVGAGQIQNSGAIGEFSLLIDLSQHPTPTGLVAVASGETWNFQAWYRDSVGGLPTSNFTDGLEITFQ